MSHAFSMGAGYPAHEIAHYFPLCNFRKVEQCNFFPGEEHGEKSIFVLLKEGILGYMDLNNLSYSTDITQHMQAPARVPW